MFVLSIECLRGLGNGFIIKELAIIELKHNDEQNIQNLHFEAPYPSYLLPNYIRRTNRWITRTLHGMEWGDGYIPYSKLKILLSDAIGSDKNIFAKGSENCAILSNILGREVSNLEIFGCPKVDDIDIPMVSCIWNHRSKSCAINKGLKYASWLYQQCNDVMM